jgi:hypothetical protein
VRGLTVIVVIVILLRVLVLSLDSEYAREMKAA